MGWVTFSGILAKPVEAAVALGKSALVAALISIHDQWNDIKTASPRFFALWEQAQLSSF